MGLFSRRFKPDCDLKDECITKSMNFKYCYLKITNIKSCEDCKIYKRILAMKERENNGKM